MTGGKKAIERAEEYTHLGERQMANEFLSFNPPEYFGSTDPSVTWKWIVEMEEIFDACGCDEQHKVKHAVRMLRGWGLDWWATFSESTGKKKASSLDWVDFKDRMTKDFCLEEHMLKLENEFVGLQKNKMNVEEYAHEFVKNMRLVKHLIVDENYKIRRFTEGLPIAYREDVSGETTLTKAIFRAISIEKEEKAKLARRPFFKIPAI